MKTRTLVILSSIALVSWARSADAASLYWAKTPVRTASVKTCLSFAASAMRAVGIQNIRISSMEVAGTRGAVYAAITCFATTPQASAIAMAAGDNIGETKRLSEELQQKIAGVATL